MRSLAAIGGLGLALLIACEPTNGGAFARRISAPEELIGGPGALGQVGDWALGNEQFRVIIQDQGWSRGFGLFGGGIIDADLQRAGAVGNAGGGAGKDNFGELFPAVFLQAFDVEDQARVDPQTHKSITLPGIEVIKDGSDGGEAMLRTRASGGDFLTLVSELLGAAIPARGLRFETDYVVRPGTRHVEIIGRLLNAGGQPVQLPDPGLASLLERFGIQDLQVPLGDVTLFGEGNEVFAPGAVDRGDGVSPKPVGFDLRFAVDASYSIPRVLPALPGLVVDFLATSGPEVSYGFAVADHERNYVWMNRGEYEKDRQVIATQHSMLVPFLLESFAGAYSFVPPARLEPEGQPGDTFEYTRYFIIGTGDVASIRDELYEIRGSTTAKVSGRVVNAKSGEPEVHAAVQILDSQQRPYSQVRTDEHGRFICRLERGTYYYRITAPGRYPTPAKEDLASTRFDTWACGAGAASMADCAAPTAKDAEIYAEIPDAAHLAVTVRDGAGRPLPAKISVVSTYADTYTSKDPMTFLFDLSLGEARRSTDLTWRDGAQNEQRRFVAEVVDTPNGIAALDIRPSCTSSFCYVYDVYVSRGPEYDVHVTRGLRLVESGQRQIDAVLHRVVDTTDWLATDMHVHSINSVDSFMPLDERVTAAAAEGLEVAVATDHNFVTDYAPVIAGLGLQDWLAGVVGVELSTLEMGHFNAFPLTHDISAPSRFPFVGVCNNAEAKKVNKTAFDWVECSPQQLFDNVRQLGRYGAGNTIVQVNHPRDTMLGYFNQYYVNPHTAEPEIPSARNYPETSFFIYPHDRVPGQYSPASFSWDFDALEVLNGKRLDQLHAFKVSARATDAEILSLQDICHGGHPDNGPGKVRLRNGGYTAYPGAVDDWLHMLNAGSVFTATGNSDSHSLKAEVGTPRTYLYVEPANDGTPRDGSPMAVHDLDIVDAIHHHRALVSNGPFLNMTVVTRSAEDMSATQTWHVGDTVAYARSNVGREVNVLLTLRSAPWIQVEAILVYGNGAVIDSIQVPLGQLDGHDIDDETTFSRTYAFDRDTVLVAEARGSVSMFPMVTPREEPPTNIGDALSGIVSGMGLSSTFNRGDGVITPSYIQKVTPYALTNPIWLDIDASGWWNPPGNPPGPTPAPDPRPSQCAAAASLTSHARPMPRATYSASDYALAGERRDIRRLFRE